MSSAPKSDPTRTGAGTDGFASTFGQQRGRGTTKPVDEKQLTRRERARLIADWIQGEASRSDRLARVRDEHQRADELDLFLVHGTWQESGYQDDDGYANSMLTFINDKSDEECIGIIEIDPSGTLTLHLRDEPAGRTLLGR